MLVIRRYSVCHPARSESANAERHDCGQELERIWHSPEHVHQNTRHTLPPLAPRKPSCRPPPRPALSLLCAAAAAAAAAAVWGGAAAAAQAVDAFGCKSVDGVVSHQASPRRSPITEATRPAPSRSDLSSNCPSPRRASLFGAVRSEEEAARRAGVVGDVVGGGGRSSASRPTGPRSS